MDHENNMEKQELDNQALETAVGGLDRLQAPEGIGAGDWNYFWWMVGEGKQKGMTLEEEINKFSVLPLFSNSSPAQVRAWIKEIYEQY